MDLKRFNDVVEEQLTAVRETLVSKGAEYVPGEAKSRFHNFDVGAALNGQTSTETLWGYLTKHLVSLADMVKGDSTYHDPAKWDEKIGDAITYLVLLRAMVADNEENDALRKTTEALMTSGMISKEEARDVLASVDIPTGGIGPDGVDKGRHVTINVTNNPPLTQDRNLIENVPPANS